MLMISFKFEANGHNAIGNEQCCQILKILHIRCMYIVKCQ